MSFKRRFMEYLKMFWEPQRDAIEGFWWVSVDMRGTFEGSGEKSVTYSQRFDVFYLQTSESMQQEAVTIF